MTLLIQHGYGKSDKIDRALDAGHAEGVILSPRDETPDAIRDLAETLRGRDDELVIFLDPQFYVSTIVDPRAGKLPDYPYFESELSHRDFIRGTDIARYVDGALSFQRDLSVTHICSPTICFDGFGDRWNTVALSMATEAINNHAVSNERRPLLVSMAMHEQAFRAEREFNDFLDTITEFDCAGFYFIVRREAGSFQQNMDPAILSPLLHMTHTLGALNEFEVHFGYTDFLSIPLHAAGATSTACGWQLGLRRFTYARFEQASGGRAPSPRYSSLPLLNSVMVTPELDQIQEVGALDDVLCHTEYDDRLDVSPPSAASWPNDISALHHWSALAAGIEAIESEEEPEDQLDEAGRLIQEARELYNQLREAGVQLKTESGPGHLEQWARGIDEFRRARDI